MSGTVEANVRKGHGTHFVGLFINAYYISFPKFQCISAKMIKNSYQDDSICHQLTKLQRVMFENCVADNAFILSLA